VSDARKLSALELGELRRRVARRDRPDLPGFDDGDPPTGPREKQRRDETRDPSPNDDLIELAVGLEPIRVDERRIVEPQ
jgi:hypothetical protein